MREINPVWAEDDPAGGSLATGGSPETGTETPQDTPPQDTPDWMGTFPDEVKKNVGRYKTPEELAKAYVNLQSQLGKSVQIPGKDASDEDWGKWYKRIGRPDSPDGYELSNVERDAKLPEDQQGAETQFARAAHQHGLTKEQARRMWKYMLDQSAGMLNAIAASRKEALAKVDTQLRSELGGEYNAGLQLMKRVVGRFADAEAKKALDEGLGNDPRLVRMLINIGKVMSEDTLEGRVPSGASAEETPEPGVFTYDQSPGMTGEQRFGRMRR